MDGVSTEDPIIRRRAGEALDRWAGEGRATAVVCVLERRGFGAVEPGQLQVVTTGGERAGALLGGSGTSGGRGFVGALGSRHTQAARRAPLGGTAGRIGG